MRRFVSILLLISIGVCGRLFAQQKPYPDPPPLPDYSQYRSTSMQRIQEQYPTLYQLEERIAELNRAINDIKNEYESGELSQDEAMERLRPVLLERVRLENSLEYQTEQQLVLLLPKEKEKKQHQGKLVIK